MVYVSCMCFMVRVCVCIGGVIIGGVMVRVFVVWVRVCIVGGVLVGAVCFIVCGGCFCVRVVVVRVYNVLSSKKVIDNVRRWCIVCVLWYRCAVHRCE